MFSYPLLGQQTPGTNSALKQIDLRKLSKLTSKIGQSWISTHRPPPPSGVVHLGAPLRVILPSFTWLGLLYWASALRSPLNSSDLAFVSCAILPEWRLRLVPSNSTKLGRGGNASLMVDIPSPTYCNIKNVWFANRKIIRVIAVFHRLYVLLGSTISKLNFIFMSSSCGNPRVQKTIF